VARSIKDQPWGRGVLMVALTGLGEEDDRRRSQEAGFDLHLVKPVEPDVLHCLFDTGGRNHLDADRPSKE
jgi:CheY-like chemotaxis protein